jgi:hypothetical protein
MIGRMKTSGVGRKCLLMLVCLLATAGVPRGAAAQDLEIETDARMEGYGDKMNLPDPSNTAMTWAGFGFVAVVALLGMFKDARRSHLD